MFTTTHTVKARPAALIRSAVMVAAGTRRSLSRTAGLVLCGLMVALAALGGLVTRGAGVRRDAAARDGRVGAASRDAACPGA